MVKKYQKKPVVIEAIQYTEDSLGEVLEFINGENFESLETDFSKGSKELLTIQTLEGLMTASIGDYIIKGIQGEFYPCKPDIFNQTYREVFDSEESKDREKGEEDSQVTKSGNWEDSFF